MSNPHLWLTGFRYTMEINLHDGVRAVDAAVGKNKKKIASAVGKEKIASAMGKRANAGAMGTGKNPKVESKKSVKATNKKKGDQNVKGKMVSMGNKGNGEKANATKASAGEKEEKEEKGKGRE